MARRKLQILERIQVSLKSGNIMEKRARAALKAIRDVLTLELRLRLWNGVKVNATNLLMVHILLGLTISVVVMYQYINDQIISIVTRLDSAESGDY
ncbi:uncharacterized protein LOC118742904 isoform X2 [Rhagoletis pomonella]|uniref:uncharacterized protein LOC118742904 isoform X2 n=1 Tax=Rhagoletis pomonella TaxID=28610 RepID=UPI001785A306|nr:uncharacterized protein LOC118742904 isoform X2 [Rhagoletis pomonella]